METTQEPAVTAEFMTEEEVALILRKSPYTLKLWRRQKIGPAYLKLDGRTILYPKSELDRYLQTRLIGATRV